MVFDMQNKIHDSDMAKYLLLKSTICESCPVRQLCFVDTPDDNGQEKLEQRTLWIKKKADLYQQHQPSQSIYHISSGSFKSQTDVGDDKKQVIGLHLAGELLGLGGLSGETYNASATALETSSVCEITLAEIENFSIKIPSLQNRLFELMGAEIVKCRRMLNQLNRYSANQKVAALILDLAKRYNGGNEDATQFHLSMTQSDLGSFLGLTVETVSRVFNKLQKDNIIAMSNKNIKILDSRALQEILLRIS